MKENSSLCCATETGKSAPLKWGNMADNIERKRTKGCIKSNTAQYKVLFLFYFLYIKQGIHKLVLKMQ